MLTNDFLITLIKHCNKHGVGNAWYRRCFTLFTENLMEY